MYAACHYRLKGQHFIITWCLSVPWGRQSGSLRGLAITSARSALSVQSQASRWSWGDARRGLSSYSFFLTDHNQKEREKGLDVYISRVWLLQLGILCANNRAVCANRLIVVRLSSEIDVLFDYHFFKASLLAFYKLSCSCSCYDRK